MILKKFLGLWAVMHVLVDVYITPVLVATPDLTFLEAVTSLILPFTGAYFLIFYIVFDVVTNGFAELTRFADREFYSDWWNRYCGRPFVTIKKSQKSFLKFIFKKKIYIIFRKF
jgi:hypothetical protein